MNNLVTKREGIHISLAALLAWLPLLPVMWFVVKPILVLAVSEAMAEDLQEQIKREVAPINSAFSVLLKKDLKNLRKEVAALEYRRDNTDLWTAEDADNLVDQRMDLEAAREAIQGLRGSP